MDKLPLAIEFTRNLLKAGFNPRDINITHIYDLIDRIEDQGVDRGVITETICIFCKKEISFIDMSTQGDRSFTAHCNCRRGKGVSKIMALKDWRMQPEGVNSGF